METQQDILDAYREAATGIAPTPTVRGTTTEGDVGFTATGGSPPAGTYDEQDTEQPIFESENNQRMWADFEVFQREDGSYSNYAPAQSLLDESAMEEARAEREANQTSVASIFTPTAVSETQAKVESAAAQLDIVVRDIVSTKQTIVAETLARNPIYQQLSKVEEGLFRKAAMGDMVASQALDRTTPKLNTMRKLAEDGAELKINNDLTYKQRIRAAKFNLSSAQAAQELEAKVLLAGATADVAAQQLLSNPLIAATVKIFGNDPVAAKAMLSDVNFKKTPEAKVITAIGANGGRLTRQFDLIAEDAKTVAPVARFIEANLMGSGEFSGSDAARLSSLYADTMTAQRDLILAGEEASINAAVLKAETPVGRATPKQLSTSDVKDLRSRIATTRSAKLRRSSATPLRNVGTSFTLAKLRESKALSDKLATNLAGGSARISAQELASAQAAATKLLSGMPTLVNTFGVSSAVINKSLMDAYLRGLGTEVGKQ